MLEMGDKIKILKENIISGCRNALDAFKQKGVSALNNVVGFFKIKPALISMCNNIDNSIDRSNKSISKVELMSKETCQTGRHLRNIGRAFIGKAPIEEAKPIGKMAKAIIAPTRLEIACLNGMKKHISGAIHCLDKLEKTAEKCKPSVIATMEGFEQKIKQADKQSNKEALVNPSLDATKVKDVKSER